MTAVSQKEFAQALLDPERAIPVGLTSFNGSDPAQRFAIYRNNVIVSLIEALAGIFPVTQALVGDDFFRGMARIYAVQSPPQSRQMINFGNTFPDFIADFEPARPVPYLADVARLENRRVAIYHAADGAPLPLSALSTIHAERLPSAKFSFLPALQWLISDYAVASLWGAHQGLADIADIDPWQPEAMLIIKPEMDVLVIPVTTESILLMEKLLNGATLADAATELLQQCPGFDPALAFQTLLQTQIITAIHFDGE